MKSVLGRSSLVWLLIMCALIGVAVSAISLNDHYSNTKSFCTISEKINCDVVNRGPYSEILGVPIALLGIIGYTLFGIFVFFHKSLTKKLAFEKKDYWFYLSLMTGSMLSFALYLTALEIFVIHAFCILCVISQGTVLIMALLTWWAWHTEMA
ncbi:vitamin K epoxide reductase family protein [Candidatus Woesearchaeota archaeon]|nr:vitamin K epoxide reductase family protein [Candidatus Woesearchaeota archaeon]